MGSTDEGADERITTDGNGWEWMTTPRAIYLAAAQTVAEALAADGYAFHRSRPALQRRTRDFVFRIDFQSSHHNASGKLSTLWLHGHVFSPTLKRWRAARPCLQPGHDFVAGGQIGNLAHPPEWLEWNLAQTRGRERTLAEASAAIRRLIYPYFAQFDDIPGLIAQLRMTDIPAFAPASALDFIACFGSPAEAERAAQNMIRRLPGARERYSIALEQFQREGLPAHVLTQHGEVLAAATLIYGFQNL